MPWNERSSGTPGNWELGDVAVFGVDKERSMKGHRHKQAIIVGAGVIGCAIALELARRGYMTINVDKNPEVGYGIDQQFLRHSTIFLFDA